MGKRIIASKSPNLAQPFSAQLLGEAVRARRTQSQLKIEDAAALCGVAKQTFMRIEHGESVCKFGSVLQVCHGLGIQLSILPWDEALEDDWL